MSLLDTPGHQDFSEDTYRALIAADSVVMVIDAAKGVEAQTRKLFEVCRRHRPADPDVRQQVRPPGARSARAARRHRADARHRRGAGELADRRRRALPRRVRPRSADLLLYEREAQGQYRAPVDVADRSTIRDARELIGEQRRTRISASRSTSSARAGTRFDVDEYLRGRQTPVFFGSALDELRPRAVPAARSSSWRRRRSRAPSDVGIVEPDRRPTSPGSCSRSRRTWIRGTATASRSCASARAGSRRTWCVSNSRVGQADAGCRAPTGSSAATARRSRSLCRRHHRPRQSRAVRDRRHAAHRARRCDFRDVPRFPAEHFGRVRLQDTRYKQFDEGAEAARGRRADAGVLRRGRPPRADRRRRRRAAVRRDRQPAARPSTASRCRSSRRTYAAARWLAEPRRPKLLARRRGSALPSIGRTGA